MRKYLVHLELGWWQLYIKYSKKIIKNETHDKFITLGMELKSITSVPNIHTVFYIKTFNP